VASEGLQALIGGSCGRGDGAYEHTINMQAKNSSSSRIVLMGRAPQIAVGVSTKAVPN